MMLTRKSMTLPILRGLGELVWNYKNKTRVIIIRLTVVNQKTILVKM